ncbi:Ig-like domain-containing protein, partial [Thermoproteota archaeon]
GTDIGTATITAEWGILPPLPVSVDISSGEMSLDADPLTITANPIVISQITAYVTLNGSPLGGETVTFTNQRPDLGYLDSTTVITNATGHANVTFTPTSIGTTTVIAEWGTLIRLIAVEIV